MLRLAEARATEPTAAVLDSRTVRSTPGSRARAGYDGAKRRRGSKVHAAVDILGRPPSHEAPDVTSAAIDRFLRR